MDKRPLMAPGPVQGTALRPRECHWQSLQTGKLSTPEIGFSTPSVRHEGERFRFEEPAHETRRVDITPPSFYDRKRCRVPELTLDRCLIV